MHIPSCSSDVLFFVFHKHKARSFLNVVYKHMRGILTRTRGILTRTRGILTHMRGILTRMHGILTRMRGILTHMHGILTHMHGILTRMHGCLHCICVRTYKAAQAHTYIIQNGIRFGVLPPSLHPSPFTRLTPHNHLFGIFLRWYFIM